MRHACLIASTLAPMAGPCTKGSWAGERTRPRQHAVALEDSPAQALWATSPTRQGLVYSVVIGTIGDVLVGTSDGMSWARSVQRQLSGELWREASMRRAVQEKPYSQGDRNTKGIVEVAGTPGGALARWAEGK